METPLRKACQLPDEPPMCQPGGAKRLKVQLLGWRDGAQFSFWCV
jgi:hypothetical protein